MSTYVLDARTATPHFPGIGRYVTNLAPAIATQLKPGETLVILCPPTNAVRFADCVGPQVRLVPCDVSPFSLRQQWQIPRWLHQLVRTQTSKVSNKTGNHQHLVYHSAYYLMPYSLRVPTVLTFYDLIPLRYPTYVSRRARTLFRLTMGMALNVATHVVAISEAARQDLIEAFRVPSAKATTTPLAPDPRFRPQMTTEIVRVRNKYDLPDSFLLSVGINKPHKNLVALIEAFASKPQLAEQTTLVLAGPWDERYPQAKTVAVQHQMGNSVRFVGLVDESDLPGLYAAATAFVFPSQYEGFGLPVLEAMACGTPVVASNTSSLPQVAGIAAIQLDPLNIESWAAALGQVIGNEALRKEMSQKGLKHVAQFSWDKTASQTLAIYRRLGIPTEHS